GVDTHAELHVAAALDERGRLLGTCTIPTTATGFAELVRWTTQFGEIARVGMEGTGSYGAGFARWLRARDVAVVRQMSATTATFASERRKWGAVALARSTNRRTASNCAWRSVSG